MLACLVVLCIAASVSQSKFSFVGLISSLSTQFLSYRCCGTPIACFRFCQATAYTCTLWSVSQTPTRPPQESPLPCHSLTSSLTSTTSAWAEYSPTTATVPTVPRCRPSHVPPSTTRKPHRVRTPPTTARSPKSPPKLQSRCRAFLGHRGRSRS